jgi:hypothetical protein
MRLISRGTPSRTKEYLFPRNRLFLFWVSLAAAFAVAAVLSLAVLRGTKTIASPGPLSSAHAPFEPRCANCHAPAVVDVRCENCHDQFGSNRYRNAGHVWFGTKDPSKLAKAVEVDCARCHSDHHGRDFLMKRIDERDCARCHFRTMDVHPEFDLVKAGLMKDEGLLFTHGRHVEEMRKARLDRCQSCHEATADRRGFEALTFDRHCARCHGIGGVISTSKGNPIPSDPLQRTAVILPGGFEPPLATDVKELPRQKVQAEKLAHRDQWVILNLWKISREVDPQGFTGRRARLVAKLKELDYQLREPPTRGRSVVTLRKDEQRLASRVAALSRDPVRSSERKRASDALARVRVLIELGPPQMTAPRPRARPEVEEERALRQAELEDFDYGGTLAEVVSPADREPRLAAAGAMTAPCVLCHIYNGALMQPVRAAVPVLDRAVFNHAPHLLQLPCEKCHAQVSKSKRADQVNLPGVATCQNCHRPGKSRHDCAECHLYHPPTEPWPPI